MIYQKTENFKLGAFHREKVTDSSGLALLMSFLEEIGLGKRLERDFGHLKVRQSGYSVSAKVFSFLQMVFKWGDRLNDLDIFTVLQTSGR